MPVKRKVGTLKRTLGPLEVEHLLSGSDHLLADGPGFRCWICARGIESARTVWRNCDRDEVLAQWRELAMPFVSFAEAYFDGARLGPLNPTWRHLYRETWHAIAGELAALADDAQLDRAPVRD